MHKKKRQRELNPLKMRLKFHYAEEELRLQPIVQGEGFYQGLVERTKK